MNQVYVGSIPIGHLKINGEGIRLDEETVLKTVGVFNRFGVRVPGLPLFYEI